LTAEADEKIEPLRMEKISTLMENIQWLMQEVNEEVGMSELAMGAQ